ncbi:hypothetical protein LEN26_012972 [Aphanomyces euteiches]|nr:hypothetical protein LEN26_012972 [Aphanomyces euteiches]
MCENCGKSRTVKNDLDEILTVDETPFDEPMTVDADWTALLLDKMVAADVARLHPKRKLFRDGTSSRTLRRKKMLNAKAHSACPMQRLDNWFLVSGAPTEEATPNMPDLACVKQLQEILTGKDLNTTLFVKLAVVLKFFEARMDGASRLSAATTAANCLPSVFHLGPRTVQNWAKAYARDGQLPESQRGKHQKSSSMIHDEDFLSKCGKWLRTTLPPQRTPRNFQLYLNEILLPSLTGALQTTVSIETSRRWMIHAGYKYGAWSKDVFLDGHERHDVVEYRADFCRKWIELSKRMVSYTGPDMETVECPENSVLEPVVWLTHDESVFYANDDGGMIWTNSAHPDLPKKSRGRSIMVSDFLCPCHGRLYMPTTVCARASTHWEDPRRLLDQRSCCGSSEG